MRLIDKYTYIGQHRDITQGSRINWNRILFGIKPEAKA